MKITALRGVCIGVDRHLQAGDHADLDPAMVTFLMGIGAVERTADAPAPVPSEEPEEKKPIETDPAPVPAKSNKKEK